MQPVHEAKQNLGAQIVPVRGRKTGLAITRIERAIDAGVRMLLEQRLQPRLTLLRRGRGQQRPQ
jgi:hypothetical protein